MNPNEVEITRNNGPKKPLILTVLMQVKDLTPNDLIKTANSLTRLRKRDLEFMKDVTSGVPEYYGYNKRKTREEGQSLKPLGKAIYLPLIDMPPAEYDNVSGVKLRKKCKRWK